MLSNATEAITSGISGILTSITSAIPDAFDNLFVGTEGNLTNFAQITFYFLGFAIAVGSARMLASKVG